MAAVELESSVWVEPPLMEVELLRATVKRSRAARVKMKVRVPMLLALS